MLKIELDEDAGIATLEPGGELSESDFSEASRLIDPFLEKNNELKGIIIHVKFFPGWDSFSSLVAHLKFVKDHHKKIARIAFATDSPIGNFAEKVATHFVDAEIRNFAFEELENSRRWILGNEV